jgi:predicted DNA-binding transcriptional regulator AlpA
MQSITSNKPQSAVIEVRDGWEKIPLFPREKTVRSEIVEISHGTLWDWVAKGTFPAPLKLSSGVTAWKRCDLIAWADGTWVPEDNREAA